MRIRILAVIVSGLTSSFLQHDWEGSDCHQMRNVTLEAPPGMGAQHMKRDLEPVTKYHTKFKLYAYLCALFSPWKLVHNIMVRKHMIFAKYLLQVSLPSYILSGL